jgi:hypothetical protein
MAIGAGNSTFCPANRQPKRAYCYQCSIRVFARIKIETMPLLVQMRMFAISVHAMKYRWAYAFSPFIFR